MDPSTIVPPLGIPGWASDAADATRPGVPMERRSSTALVPADSPLTAQVPRVEVLRSRSRKGLSLTFGTGQPPTGVSGVIRRLAYSLPDHRAPKWMILLMADRLNALERRRGGLLLPVAALALVGGVWLATRRRR